MNMVFITEFSVVNSYNQFNNLKSSRVRHNHEHGKRKKKREKKTIYNYVRSNAYQRENKDRITG